MHLIYICGKNPRIYSFSFGFIRGNRITSRMLSAPVSIITRRSIPMPKPPAGGMPYLRALRKSSSTFCCSSLSPT